MPWRQPTRSRSEPVRSGRRRCLTTRCLPFGSERPAAWADIPFWDGSWYDCRMTTQIAVRLPDDMVAFLDTAVASGAAPSRAALVARAVEREARRQAAEADAAILRASGPDEDLDALVTWSAGQGIPEA